MLSTSVPILTNSSHKPEDTTVQIQTEGDMFDGTRETFLRRPVKFHDVKDAYEECEKRSMFLGGLLSCITMLYLLVYLAQLFYMSSRSYA